MRSLSERFKKSFKLVAMLRTANRILVVFLAFVLVSPAAFAKISVTANVDSGTYDRAFSVTLTPSDPAAKLFYTFEPDGSPMDAYAYTGAIRVSESTPLMYFAFVDPTNESLIYRRDYELIYPNHLSFSVDPKERIVSLVNFSEDPANTIALDSWTLKKDGTVLYIFGKADFLTVWKDFSVAFPLPPDVSAYGEYQLIAPDETKIADNIATEQKPASDPAMTPYYGRVYSAPARPTTVTADDNSAAEQKPFLANDEPNGDAEVEKWEKEIISSSADIEEPTETMSGDTVSSDSATQAPIMNEPTKASNDATDEVNASTPSQANENAPDITASARGSSSTFAGFAPIVFMFLLALGGWLYRALRGRAQTAKKLR